MESAQTLLARLPYADGLIAARAHAGVSAWCVGGCIRDLLLGRTPADVDVAAEEPEKLAQSFAALHGGHVVPMDQENGIWRVAVAAGAYLDFCRFRDTDIVGDLRERDFTINAMAIRLPDKDHLAELLDPFGGADDLHAGLLRMANDRAFRDDPARVLRAFRFQADLGFTIEPRTWEALTRESPRLQQVAPERLLAEWWKLCAGPHAHTAIHRMDDARTLTALFPELAPERGVTQNVYHHLDVWGHSLLAVDNMHSLLREPEPVLHELLPAFAPVFSDEHRKARLIFLALLHDIGKPATRTVKQGRVHFYGHDVVGAEIAQQLCRRLRISNDDTRVITTVIRHHLRPLHLMNARKHHELSTKSLIAFFDDAGDVWPEIMLLALADKAAGRGPAAEPDVHSVLRDLYRDLLDFYTTRYRPAVETPLLNGNDLITHLGLPPGPKIGALLRRTRDRQISGHLKTHKEALTWAKKHKS